MTTKSTPQPDRLELELRDPGFSAFLAWLFPGAGHLYQRRYAKGWLFMSCILGTFLFGLILGEGRVVYAAWPIQERWSYVCQIGVGLPALPAVVQSLRVRQGKEPLWDKFMAPPVGQATDRMGDELDQLHRRLHRNFELGTMYTVIAGLLNVLVIYDAWRGPAYFTREEKQPPDKPATTET